MSQKKSCGGFHDHTQICCYVDNGDGRSNIQNDVVGNSSFREYSYASSSSVDCTLSLGTPSTRLSEKDEKKRRSNSSSRVVSNFLDTDKSTPKTASYSVLPFAYGGGSDSLLDRRCTNCDTKSTPLWRNGPRGPKSLCNACGIRFKKEERRTTTTVVTPGSAIAEDHQYGQHHSSYNHHNATENGSSMCSYVASEIRFIHDYGGAGEYYRRDPVDGVNGVPFHSWRLNVADTATSLVYDSTR